MGLSPILVIPSNDPKRIHHINRREGVSKLFNVLRKKHAGACMGSKRDKPVETSSIKNEVSRRVVI